MKNETPPTCPICSATMEESRYKKITVCYHCLACEYATKNDFDRMMREEAIINGEFDEEICMAERKLPTERDCEQFAEHVAEDMKPKGSWDSEEYEMFWFKPYQLDKLIKFCQGKPIQDELWKND